MLLGKLNNKADFACCANKAACILIFSLAFANSGYARDQSFDVERSVYAKAFKVQPNHANIYVYRDTNSDFNGDSPIAIDSKNLGVIKGRSFVFFEVLPGKHFICGDSIDHVLSLNADSGKSYFIAATLMGTRFNKYTAFDITDEIEGKTEVRQDTMVSGTNQATATIRSNATPRSMHK